MTHIYISLWEMTPEREGQLAGDHSKFLFSLDFSNCSLETAEGKQNCVNEFILDKRKENK